jgi:hypothetical protein
MTGEACSWQARTALDSGRRARRGGVDETRTATTAIIYMKIIFFILAHSYYFFDYFKFTLPCSRAFSIFMSLQYRYFTYIWPHRPYGMLIALQ